MQKQRRATARLIPRSFFARSSDVVAPDLLGKILVHEIQGTRVSGRIIETEAYLGLDDPASHAYRGQSPANAILFGPPGLAHVYLIYGLHYCLSISAHQERHAGGVLIRALLPMTGVELMAELRGKPGATNAQWLTGVPGRVCQAFGIDRKTYNGIDVTRRPSPLRIIEDEYKCTSVSVTKRIGITKGADHPLRFVCDLSRS
ncbi:DNA-3-methyladenine glycosylase [Terriglobus roseus]|uniref:Putative 3-methyladenine DNA glycosylase n=1 Tax=Terriglobus roseus TaxID=392734 RepID=A0A1G7JBM0_9BACT|nr:DNA-3-methyladenine glycosylase [Terriglobus roseus]SDF22286.1 DNA-3-methyladenine glycosylase [Terriglobus roseus]